MSEEWRKIPGWPYEASSMGRIRRATAGASTRSGRVLRCRARHGDDSYRQVRLSRGSRRDSRTFCVHQLVALAFFGLLPEGWHTNHKNGDKTDDRVVNLEYVTAKGNVQHAIANGFVPEALRGERSPSAKLTEDAVRDIRTTPKRHGSITGLARKYGVDRGTIYRVLNGETWGHVE